MLDRVSRCNFFTWGTRSRPPFRISFDSCAVPTREEPGLAVSSSFSDPWTEGSFGVRGLPWVLLDNCSRTLYRAVGNPMSSAPAEA